MTADLAIITAIFGDYEDLKPPLAQVGVDVEWICVSDLSSVSLPGWRMVYEESTNKPVLNAKRPKCLPWEYTDAPASIWLDGSFRVTSPHMARSLLALANPIAQFRHPDRDCIYQEADVSQAMQRYAHLPIAEQMAAYRAYEHPERWGLWAAGVIVRLHTAAVRSLGGEWLAQCHHWGHQDQLSEAPCLRANKLRPVPIPGSVYENPWFAFEPSRRHLENRR